MRSKLFLVIVWVIFLVTCTTGCTSLAELTHARQRTLIVEEIQNVLAEERVMHPNQLNLEDIHTGDILILVNMDGQLEALILTEPRWENDSCGFYLVAWKNNAPEDDSIFRKTCADAGLIEYPVEELTGWHPTNHILPSGDPPLTPEQLEEVLFNLIEEPSEELLQIEQGDA